MQYCIALFQTFTQLIKSEFRIIGLVVNGYLK